MAEMYNHHTVEKKWQKVWDDEKAFLGNRVIPEYILRLVLYKLEMEKIIPSGLLESMDEK